MQSIWRKTALAVAVLGLAACVRQVWQVTYSGQGDFSSGQVLAVADNGTSYLGGFISQGQLFVAAYDANGALLWEKLIDAGTAGNNLYPGKMMALDTKGDIYFASLRYPEMASSLYKLDGRTGDLLLSVELPEGEAFNHMHVGPDGLLYMEGWSGVGAYTGSGERLWSHQAGSSLGDELENGETPPTLELDAYQGSVFASAAANATGPYRIERFAFVGSRTYVLFSDRIIELDGAGQILNELTADALGVSSFESLTSAADSLMAVSHESGAVVSVLLDADLAQQSRHSLAAGPWHSVRVSGGNEQVCVGLYDAASKAVEIHQLGLSGNPRWKANVVQQGNIEWEFAHVLARDSDCYLGMPVQLSNSELSTITRRYSGNGKLTDTVTLKQFVPAGLGVVGNSIYHGGSMETDDQTGMIATLVKHKRY